MEYCILHIAAFNTLASSFIKCMKPNNGIKLLQICCLLYTVANYTVALVHYHQMCFTLYSQPVADPGFLKGGS